MIRKTNIILSIIWFIIGLINLLGEFNILDIDPVPNYLYALACFTLCIAFLSIKN